MANKLIQCRRVVSYLPSLRAAVIQSKKFSTDHQNPPTAEPEDTLGKDKTPRLDDFLGTFGPQDKRFPLPGHTGFSGNSQRIANEIERARIIHLQLTPQSTFNENAVLPPLRERQHEDTIEQFLTSVDEIAEELEFVDKVMAGPQDKSKFEYRAHDCPEILRKEFQSLFPDRSVATGNFTVINMTIKTKHDMTLWTSEVEEEREALLESFIQGAVEISAALEDAGFWSDFIDPSSGKPFKGRHTNHTFFETDERYRRLGFEIRDLGCCKVISHPVWGSHAYIGTLFTDAPLNHPLVTFLGEGYHS